MNIKHMIVGMKCIKIDIIWMAKHSVTLKIVNKYLISNEWLINKCLIIYKYDVCWNKFSIIWSILKCYGLSIGNIGSNNGILRGQG